jgi:UDP-glucose 4-epimerase
MARYLVTGGSGYIGAHLVDALAEAKHDLTVIDILQPPPWLAQKALWYQRDITADLHDIFKKDDFDGVFHLAALPNVQYSIEHPEETDRINYGGTLNLLSACAKYDVPRFVFSSSASVYGNYPSPLLAESLVPHPLSPYAKQKVLSEEACHSFNRNYGINAIALRYFNVLSPRTSATSIYASVIHCFLRQAQEQKPLVIYGSGEQTRDFVFVSDVIAANIAAMENQSLPREAGPINIGSGIATPINELAEHIIRITGNTKGIMYEKPRHEPRHSCADIRKARRLLGWQPRVSLEEGLQKAWDFYRES